MKDLVILLPTCRQDMFKRCLGTLRESPFHLHVLAQKFKPKLEHIYLDEFIGSARANNHVFITAPDAKYYMFIDDDFVFEGDWIEDVKFAISNLEQHKNIGAISLLDSNKSRSHKFSKVLNLGKKELYYNDHKSVLFLRKESGIIIRKELVHTDLDITAYGEDFVFREGYRENILHAIHVLDTQSDIGCIIFSDNKNKKSQNKRINVELASGMVHILSSKEIIHARKESGLIIRRELLKESFENTPHGEDFSKIMHCYLDGYDVGMIKANITHEHDPKDNLSWDNLSRELFNKHTKFDNQYFYYRVLKDMNLLDKDGLTEIGLKVHEYNKKRRNCKFLNRSRD